ncbi:nuclear transport factor 2 family protein [Pseudomonas sp. NPDC090208]|uniref:nuclear transport factor 2 family protein n=1 Tax=Pseudomonas sp. NPDC090208 TaxID=3364478 RepID=UPI0037F12B87
MKDMFDCVDCKDVEGFLSYLADDVVFRFGNAQPMRGKQAVREGVLHFNSQIVSLEHVLNGVWTHEHTTILEFDSYYTRHDEMVVGVPCVVVLRFNPQRRISDYRINIDLSPVFATAPDTFLIRASA